MFKEQINAIVNILNEVIVNNLKAEEQIKHLRGALQELATSTYHSVDDYKDRAREALEMTYDNTAGTNNTDGHTEGSSQSAPSD